MKKGRLAQWEILDRVRQRTRGCGPRFIQLNQRRFNLGRIQRGSGFLFDPTRAFHHAKDAAKLEEILLSIFRELTGLDLTDFFARLRKKTTFGAGQTLDSFARNFLKQRVDFERDKFRRCHALHAVDCFAPAAQ